MEFCQSEKVGTLNPMCTGDQAGKRHQKNPKKFCVEEAICVATLVLYSG